MPSFIDITGHVFGRLTATSRAPTVKKITYWHVVCECGKELTVQGCALKTGNTKSCGCLFKEAHTIHGMSQTSTYYVWNSMVQRCNSPGNQAYFHYGAKGVEVCERWLKFENFLADMGVAPNGMSLDRKNGNLGYSKGNCRWATITEQNRNRSNVKMITYNGATKTAPEWGEALGLDANKLRRRISSGWTPARAIETSYKLNQLNN